MVLHLALWLLLAVFFAIFFNRFAGVRSGNGEFSGGVALLQGHLPYQQYFTAGPPLNALKSALLLRVFGPYLIVSRLFSVLERLVMASLLLCWLRQFVPPRAAFLASLLAIVLSAGDHADPIASYNHDALLLATGAGLLSSIALGSASGWLFALYGLGAGVCAGLSLLTKQTVGGVVLLTLALVPAAFRFRKGMQSCLAWLGTYAIGALLPVLLVCGVLARLHVLRSALTMLFVTGPSAKAARPGEFLIRWGLVACDNAGWICLGAFWCALVWLPARKGFRNQNLGDEPVGKLWIVKVVCGVLCLVGLADILAASPALHDLTKSVIFATVFMLLAILGWAVRSATRVQSDLRTQRLILMAAVSMATAFALSLSWPVFEAMLLPGVALVTALALYGVSPRLRPLLYGVLAFLGLMQLREKLNLPFAFGHQSEAPVYQAVQRSSLPALKGMRLPQATINFLDQATDVIVTHTCPTDPVFTYPEMGLLYTLSNRWPPTWSPSHNIDVVNDVLAKQDAERVLKARPLVLITYQETEQQTAAAERLWRQGRPSGQRDIASAVKQLERNYRLYGTYVLRAGDPPIQVYLRPDATTNRAHSCIARSEGQ